MKRFVALLTIGTLCAFVAPAPMVTHAHPVDSHAAIDCAANPLAVTFAGEDLISYTTITTDVQLYNPAPAYGTYMRIEMVASESQNLTDSAFDGGYIWSGNYTNSSAGTFSFGITVERGTQRRYCIYRYCLVRGVSTVCPNTYSEYRYGAIEIRPRR